MFGARTPEEKEALRRRLAAALSLSSSSSSAATAAAAAARVGATRPVDSDEDEDEGAQQGQHEGGADEATRPPQHAASAEIAAEALREAADDEEVEVNNLRIFSLDELDLTVLRACTSLSMRKNVLHKLAPLPQPLAQRLRVLDLFDNKLRRVGDFFVTTAAAPPAAAASSDEATPDTATPQPPPPPSSSALSRPFASLVKLDLSYNQLRAIEGLDALAPTLRELYLVENKIKMISGLDALVHLELLELGGNRLRSIGDGLRHLVNLRQLWLGKNKIASLGTALQPLRALTLLSLQANRLTAIEADNFVDGAHPALRELYLSENGIRVLEHLPLHTLRLLDVSFNPIERINGDVVNAQNMPQLSEFWLTDAKVADWGEVDKLACFADTLRTVYLERNPIEQDKRYRDKVYMHLPFVTQIDSWPVVNKDNLEADRAIQRRGEVNTK